MVTRFRSLYAVLPVLLLAVAFPAAGQIQVGDNLNMNLNGLVTAGYNGVYGDQVLSSHGLNIGGNGTFSGFYYNPNFLSFSMTPYYGQSQQSAEARSVFYGGGFDFSSSIFGGSRFPGSIGLSRAWDSQGTFGIPGLPDYATRSNTQNFNIGWSALVPDYPTLSAIFTMGSGDYSVPGSNLSGNNNFHNFGLRSSYSIAGFNLGAFYDRGGSHSQIPQIFGTQTITNVDSGNSVAGVNATHRLPWQGAFSVNYNHSNMSTDYFGYNYQGSMNMLNASAGFQPTQKLHSSVSFGYSDNLTGTLLQSILPTSGSAVQAGDQPIAQKFNQSSNSLYVDGVSTYQVNRSLLVDVDVQRRQQSYLGTNYGVNMYGGGANYVHGVLGGFFGASLNVSAITSDFHTGHVMSFSTNANYSRGIGQWTLTGGFGYAQNVQALLVTYMSSYYTYSGSVRRRLFDGLLTWGGSAAGSRTALSQDPHTGNSNQSYTTSIGLPHYTATAAYAKSDGFGLLGGNGLVQPPNVPPGTIPPEWLILYGGHSYSFGLGATPIRKLSIGANFSRAWSDTSTGGIGSWNHVDQGNANLNYQVRKLMFTASYGRIFQGFSASGIPPSNINSFYVGFSRSFNLF